MIACVLLKNRTFGWFGWNVAGRRIWRRLRWVVTSMGTEFNEMKYTWFLLHKVGPDSDILFWEGKKISDLLFLFTLT